MTPSAEKHLQRFPSARTSKLRQLEKQDEVLSRLQREIRAKAMADKAVNQYRQDIGYRPAANALTVIIGALRVLSVKAKELVQ